MPKLTIRDIAQLAGLSKSTVSLVLNNSPKVDPATRERVLEVMRSHNYTPSSAATALAKGRTPFIGMIVPGLTWHMVAAVNYGVASVIEQSPYEIILYTSTNEKDYTALVERITTSGLSAGLLVVTHDQPLDPLEKLHRSGLPVVLVNTLGTPSSLPSVQTDNYEGTRIALRHLVELGHTRIACVQGLMAYVCCQDRYRGYLDALDEAGISPDPGLTVDGGFHPPTVRERVSELLARPDRPTAIVAQNDSTAYAVMQAVIDCGLRVPQDISVVGFDDIASSADTHPPLTTVRQPFPEMGVAAARMLLRTIDGDDAGAPDGDAGAVTSGGTDAGTAGTISMPTSLIVRESTTGAPSKPFTPARTPATGPDTPPRPWSGLGPNISSQR
ncbi:LacI family DNA-binding transcriptional regulator [Plantactinospora solaniradicis]|uniref:LacI family DNA-binding transcriptional regulator n=1 Tax=Plantactinospora solaniradicis TaxID=1723736 RepID=A0ABW1K609_9ACTN